MIFKDRSVYAPPTLPSHIPGTLEEIVGEPSDKDFESVQSAIRTHESLANVPHLFDADLSTKLSQHMFNLQFARYMHDAAIGRFVSKAEPEGAYAVESKPEQLVQGNTTVPHEIPNPQGEAGPVWPVSEVEQAPGAPSEIAQLGEKIVKSIQEATNETKGVLENTNRLLMLLKKDQSTAVGMDKYYHVYKDPLNQQGMAASESGLPRLVFGYYQNGYTYRSWLSPVQMARYLEFFGVGADLIRDGKLIDGKKEQAENLLLAQIGFKEG
ncbi:unnamed protein product [Rhizoctonia solani]|uniref:Uncharacterized protein n=1 Tax=Rhizoctonia solani TaxID=456999 RepID=A0A8H3E7Y2_9AGAM|nr:unnamed protein product [Rhizoctonia solani]